MIIKDYSTIIVGTGAAGFNAADCLFDMGKRDIAIVTEGLNMGTSRNTGSDKQTYYKLSLSGDDLDSITKMATTLFDGGAVDGDVALCEAANSLRGFYKLVSLGVNFPMNEFGEFVGYKTDHDPCKRGTSIGPYTSKAMTERLQKSVERKNIKIFDNMQIVKVVTDHKRVVGLIGLQTTDSGYEFIGFRCSNVILATGGPSAIYADSVYPISQTGSTGLAIEAGAALANMDCWQYGLASVDFRWNVSGTYMQVLPRFISVDERGNEKEFMLDYFENPKEMVKNIFLKGYQWPFDVNKIHGSSYIDLLVYNETVVKGNKVYLDFLHNPTGAEDLSSLDNEVKEYLFNSGATQSTPIERLMKMNPKAIELYRSHGIDIAKAPLRIAICSQHCNGGVDVDSHWQSNIRGLYVVGEAAGTFGLSRPGGSALNSTQVGSYRAAKAIAEDESVSGFNDNIIEKEMNALDDLAKRSQAPSSNLSDIRQKIEKMMSGNFAFVRNVGAMENELEVISRDEKTYFDSAKWASYPELKDFFKNHEILLTSELTAESMIYAAKHFGARGSSFVLKDPSFLNRLPVKENIEGRSQRIIASTSGISSRQVRPIPERELWFEKVWNQQRGDKK